MGTDIHGVMQAKVEGKWQILDTNLEEGRHYLLFAWLGNVRNGYGFAGIPTFTPITPLSDNRGLPEDLELGEDRDSVMVTFEQLPSWRQKHAKEDDGERELYDYWLGDHSHSWVTSEEILTAVLPEIDRTGVIPLATFKEWDGQQPETWSGGVSGHDVVVSSPRGINNLTTHVQVEWTTPISSELSYFIDEVKRLKEEHGELRYIFGFDS